MFGFLRIFCQKSSDNGGPGKRSSQDGANMNDRKHYSYEKVYMGSSINSLDSSDLNYFSTTGNIQCDTEIAFESSNRGIKLNTQQFTRQVYRQMTPPRGEESPGYTYAYEYVSTSEPGTPGTTPSGSRTTTASSDVGVGSACGPRTKPRFVNIFPPRTALPAPMPNADISIWAILKQCIGKDLSKITMPIVLNEPLSFLQRLAEYMEYSYLLEKANLHDNPVERMEMVAAFAVSGCATNWDRLGKPFNPLLGETYELDMPERGFRMVCEQTSHHPPISSFYAESPHFKFHGSIQPKSKFWGKALDVQPVGIITLELPNHNEVYTWSNPNCSIHNIIIGKLWIEHSGPLEIINHTNGYRCALSFRPAGMFGKEINRVDGFIFDHKDGKVRALYGHWNLALFSTIPKIYDEYLSKNVTDKMLRRRSSSSLASPKNSKDTNGQGKNEDSLIDSMEGLSVSTDQLKYANYVLNLPKSDILWKHSPKPSNSSKMYNFSLFSMMLNEPPPPEALLPPTDSRYRPDMREYEMGRIDIASNLKTALEEKQRSTAKEVKGNPAKRTSITGRPLATGSLWFKPIKSPYVKGENDWCFNEDYWKRDFSRCPDIFDLTQFQ